MSHFSLLLLTFETKPRTYRMNGSHGTVEFDETGRVLSVDHCGCADCAPHGGYDVARVDVAELRCFYETHWTLEEFERCEFDVLEVSWWNAAGQYVPADADYRLDLLNRVRDGHDI